MTQTSPTQRADALFYYADANNEAVGPLSFPQLRHLFDVGVISAETLVIEDGGSEWRQFATLAARDEAAVTPQPPPLPEQKRKSMPTFAIAVIVTVMSLLFGGILFFIERRITHPPILEVEQGQSFTKGALLCNVAACDVQTRVGGPIIGTTAETGVAFVVVSFSVENTSAETVEVSPFRPLHQRLVLRDAAGRNFQHSERIQGQFTGLFSSGNNFKDGQLQPNIPRKGQVAFEVPAVSVTGPLTLIWDETVQVLLHPKDSRSTQAQPRPMPAGTPVLTP